MAKCHVGWLGISSIHVHQNSFIFCSLLEQKKCDASSIFRMAVYTNVLCQHIQGRIALNSISRPPYYRLEFSNENLFINFHSFCYHLKFFFLYFYYFERLQKKKSIQTSERYQLLFNCQHFANIYCANVMSCIQRLKHSACIQFYSSQICDTMVVGSFLFSLNIFRFWLSVALKNVCVCG